MRFKTFLLLFFTLYFPFAECRRGEISDAEYLEIVDNGPWFTGPILAPSGTVVALGDINLEPYLNYYVYTGRYDKNWAPHSDANFYSLNPQIFIQTGVTSFMDITVTPQFYFNKTQGVSSTVFGDLAVSAAFQLLYAKKDSWYPNIKLNLKETFPTGPYQKLSPDKKETDFGGTGSFITQMGLVFSKTFKLWDHKYLSSRLYLAYSVPSSVHVKGLNTYGGGPDTHGKVYPGSFLTSILGLEFSLTKNWVFALDIDSVYNSRTRFSGDMGLMSDGQIVETSFTSSNQISLAPAIEYNFSSTLGIIAGSWFTVAGRNVPRFASGIIALNYYFSSQ